MNLNLKLMLCSDLPNEVIGVIIDLVRIINMSKYFWNKDLNFNDFLYNVNNSNCILTCKFNNKHNFISNSIIVYGERLVFYGPPRPEYMSESGLKYSRHPFDSYFWEIEPKGSCWISHFHEGNKLEDTEYVRSLYLKMYHQTCDQAILKIKLVLLNVKPREFAQKLICDKDTIVINDFI